MCGNRHIQTGKRLAIRWLNGGAVKIQIRKAKASASEQRFREGGQSIHLRVRPCPLPNQ